MWPNSSASFRIWLMSRGWKTREQMEAAERTMLAPFAQRSGESRGRKYSEPSHAYRTEFQRDRDRVIHSRAFRRLEYKTQVFLNGTGAHLRTRLTHTMEVAATARSIARALKLNEDLAETIALAHDLGHSPFGHKGEMVLDRLMKDHGGFEQPPEPARGRGVGAKISRLPRIEPFLGSARGSGQAFYRLRSSRKAQRVSGQIRFARSAGREPRRRNHLLQPRP